MVAMRGLPADYDEWRELGAAGWGWSEVLPFFIRSERDLSFAGPLHGSDGPIRRIGRERWPPFCRAFAEVLQSQGHAFLADYNGQFGDGVSALPMNNLPEQRVSTAMGYLDEAVRRRGNLTILTEARVLRLRCRERRVLGAEVRTPAGTVLLEARTTIVCAGAIHTPAVLLRSGIGPEEQLRALGIGVVTDVPGVGRNLQNHVALPLGLDIKPRAWQSCSERSWSFSVLRYSSGHAGCPQGDMLPLPMNKTSWHPVGRWIGLLGVTLLPRRGLAPGG
jgi:5-(hydroxymethyl)furfural/furfural oxidase